MSPSMGTYWQRPLCRGVLELLRLRLKKEEKKEEEEEESTTRAKRKKKHSLLFWVRRFATFALFAPSMLVSGIHSPVSMQKKQTRRRERGIGMRERTFFIFSHATGANFQFRARRGFKMK